jgi:hypothetical protein
MATAKTKNVKTSSKSAFKNLTLKKGEADKVKGGMAGPKGL